MVPPLQRGHWLPAGGEPCVVGKTGVSVQALQIINFDIDDHTISHPQYFFRTLSPNLSLP